VAELVDLPAAGRRARIQKPGDNFKSKKGKRIEKQ